MLVLRVSIQNPKPVVSNVEPSQIQNSFDHLVRPCPHRLQVGGPTGYTFGMKTAISIPDKIYAEAERLSRRYKKSRSQVYAEAVAEYLARHDSDAVTEAMNQVCGEVDTRPDPAISAAARRTLKRVEW